MGLIHAFEELLGLAGAEAAEVSTPPAPPSSESTAAAGGGGGEQATGQLAREDEDRKRAEADAASLHRQIAGLEGHVGSLEGTIGELEQRLTEPPPATEVPAEPAPETYPGQHFPTPPGVYGPPGPGGVTPYEAPGVRVGPAGHAASKLPIRNPHR